MSALLQINRPLTIQDALRQLASPPPGPRSSSVDNRVDNCYATARNAAGNSPSSNNSDCSGAEPLPAPMPYIRHESKHWHYAVCIVAGMSNEAACKEANISPRTAEGYRKELKDAVSSYIGREIEYHFAARWIMDEDLRRQCGKASQPLESYPQKLV